MLRLKILTSQILIITLVCSLACVIKLSYADGALLQQQLMSIASQQAQVAEIGANKAMMLYGVGNPIAIINKWNDVQHKTPLTNEQIMQINQLESQKQAILINKSKI
jgi:hypothetical protein